MAVTTRTKWSILRTDTSSNHQSAGGTGCRLGLDSLEPPPPPPALFHRGLAVPLLGGLPLLAPV